MELLQDAVVVLLNVTLFGMGFMFLYQVWREIIALGNLQEGLSNIIFVVITIELYRLLVHYLRYHKVDLNILVEVGVSVIIQKVVLVGVDEFTMQQLVGISLILVSLGAILWVDMYGARLIVVWGSSSARRQPRFGTLPGREREGSSDDPRNRR
jgi:uncharacterized membrane protein (DUF373 family)